MGEKILEVRNLTTSFKTERGVMNAVQGVSFHVDKGEILGLVGESGCGKSVTSQSIMRLYDERRLAHYQGEILFDGVDLLTLPEKKMQAVRGKDIAMVFQDSLSSLNPVFTCGNQIMEALMIHQKLSKREARERAIEMLRLVGIPSPETRVDQYPHELSGGMRQRVMIACALSCHPKLLIADEPTTALDVTIQAQIMELIVELNQKLNMGVILITHDLSVVAETCSRVAVMYLGQIVEEADVFSLFQNPQHPYTKGLLRSIPKMNGERRERLFIIEGSVPLLSQIPQGCRFCPRCPFAEEGCSKAMPELQSVSSTQKVRCFRAGQI
ncbi:MAG: ABC transporter ATP-binding protein [Clostridiales bacterium]|nr:ABC transporter ATP-binding protein [Clostridiales bacterium]MDD6935788.1 ABC transporter ATP-binding protein [Clostridiales bacterium]MDY2960873.1 ABC transporter ATP-binding protein [Oscillospiraceae bacterium]